MNIKDKLKKEGNVKMSAATLMYIANVLREHQIVLMQSIASAVMDGATEKELEHLESNLMANNIVGGNVLECIHKLVGPEIYEKFVESKLGDEMAEEGDDVSVFNLSTGTLN